MYTVLVLYVAAGIGWFFLSIFGALISAKAVDGHLDVKLPPGCFTQAFFISAVLLLPVAVDPRGYTNFAVFYYPMVIIVWLGLLQLQMNYAFKRIAMLKARHDERS
jgi:hypothetical protein